MVDASKGFRKDGNKNRLREQDIHRIVDTFTRQIDIPGYSRIVPFDEIADEQKNDYNLNLPRYIQSTETEDIQDIEAHLRGGIPKRDIDELAAYWQVMPNLRSTLFKQLADRPNYSQLQLPITEVKSAILNHAEFIAFNTSVIELFERWAETNKPRLKDFGRDDKPKELIKIIAEDLLETFRAAPLIDAYDVYQHLMDYWAETMQDDCYILAADGWVAKTYRVTEEIKSGKKKGEMKDKGWACDLVPKPLIVARCFPDKQAAIDALQAKLETIQATLDELNEEYGGEDGVLKDVSSKSDAQEAYIQAMVMLWSELDKVSATAYNEIIETINNCAAHLQLLKDRDYLAVLKNSKGNLTLKAVKTRFAELSPGKEYTVLADYIETDKKQKDAQKKAKELFAEIEQRFLPRLTKDPLPENLQDLQATVRYLELLDEQTKLKEKLNGKTVSKKRVPGLIEQLDLLAYEKYPQLSEDEVRTLVIDDKWLTTLETAIKTELNRVSQTLTGRIRQLAERYETPLPELEKEVEELSTRVDEHLKKMGAVWN